VNKDIDVIFRYGEESFEKIIQRLVHSKLRAYENEVCKKNIKNCEEEATALTPMKDINRSDV